MMLKSQSDEVQKDGVEERMLIWKGHYAEPQKRVEDACQVRRNKKSGVEGASSSDSSASNWISDVDLAVRDSSIILLSSAASMHQCKDWAHCEHAHTVAEQIEYGAI